MPEFKLVISDPRNGRTKTVTVSDPASFSLIGLKIGDAVIGDQLGLPGVTLKITGGSDSAGFPMIPYLPGGRKYRILMSGRPGFRRVDKGLRRRKTVRGNTVTEDIVQINMVVVEGELNFESGEEKEE